jgi:hypothetical protein
VGTLKRYGVLAITLPYVFALSYDALTLSGLRKKKFLELAEI